MNSEVAALFEAVKEQAESYLVSCVHFAKFMQTEVEHGAAIDVLKGMTEETYAKMAFYEGRLEPISGKPAPYAAQPTTPPVVSTQERRYSGGFRL